MATMATTHSLSILTNSSVKPPLNPKTGLSASLHERPGPTLGRFSGIYYDDYDQEAQAEREIFDPRFTSRPHSTDTPSLLHLGNLSDEEFYQKLLELKNEQRKILKKCEEVYREKHKGLIAPTFPDEEMDLHTRKERKENITGRSYDTFRSETFIDDDGVLVSQQHRSVSPARSPSPEEERCLSPPRSQSPVRDALSDSSGKPPTGRHTTQLTAKSVTTPLSRSKSASDHRRIARSLDDLRSAALGLQKSFEESDRDYVPDETVSEPRDNDRSMTRIEHMWHNFSVKDYTPRRSNRSLERPSSATVTRKEKKEKKDSWRHRLTVPEPFTMTLREQSKERKKTKTMKEFEEKRSQKEINEEEELKKKFKARPVPAHVYLPLYDELQEKNEEKRRQIKQLSTELLKSQEKPFSFLKREEDRKMHQRMNRDCNEKDQTNLNKETFKAKPVPKNIFDSSVEDKIMEEEEYRKIRIKMRAEELLRSATLPPNMHAREQMKEQKEREKKLKSKRRTKSAKSVTRPRINHEVPNYDALYRQFQEELQRRKGLREATVTKPFRLETERTSKSTQDRIKKEIEREEQTLKENRWPYELPRARVKLGHMSSSLDALPAKSTRSADVRKSKTKNQMQSLTQKELQEIEEERRRRVKEMRLRKEIQERTKLHDTPRENPEEKKKKFRDAERVRMEEYKRELEEMKTRINQRPLLFEQESQINAKKKAEKKFNATLRSVGLDEDFVQSRGSRSASVHDYTDDYDDDFDDTAVRQTDETYTKRHDSERSMSPVES